MSRGTWTLSKKVAGTWTSDGTIYRPNANTVLSRNSTLIQTALADGSFGFVTLETKSNADPIKFVWAYLEKVYKDKIEAYVTNLNDIKITDHNSTIYYGRFTNIEATWLMGEVDKYDISATFVIIPGLE